MYLVISLQSSYHFHQYGINETFNSSNARHNSEEEGGLAPEGLEEDGPDENFSDYNAKLCLAGRFLTEGVIDFQAMQQILFVHWKPGKGVYIKEVNVNLHLQFYSILP